MHNLGTVFRFEVIRTLKKRSFWLLSLSFPLMVGVIFGIIYFSNKATGDALEQISSEKFSLVVTDESGIVNPELIKGFGGIVTTDKQGSIDRVVDGTLDAYIYYPKDLTKQPVEVYGKDVGLFDNSKYQNVARLLLDQSASSSVPASEALVLQGNVSYAASTYKDGGEYDGMKQLIAPGIFLVLFYFLIAFFGNQMLTSTTEEKENRVIEMILTTVRARTLIIGKILSLVALGFLQTCIILVPVVIAYVLLHDNLSLPSLDISSIPLDPVRITIGALIFITSFLLFTGLLVTIGAAVPTAKEAGSFFGIVMMLIFGPLYAAPLFISSPDSPIVQALSYIPFTAPIPLMLRNAVGNLELWQAGLAIAILMVTAMIVLNIAVRVFRYGALEYSRKLSLREVFWPKK